MTAITSVPSSGIAMDTSKAKKKPPTPEQREDKNRKLREKRAAAAKRVDAEVKAFLAPVAVKPTPLPRAELPPGSPLAPKETKAQKLAGVNAEIAKVFPGKPVKMALDALPKPKVGKDKGGRRAIYGEPMHTVSFKCTKQQHATFRRAGGNVYLRARLDELTAYYAKGGK